MSAGGGGAIAPSVLETLEFPAALACVAAHAAGPLGAARVRARLPVTDPAVIRDALAQVAELAAQILSDDAIRAVPAPDIGPALELLAVPGSALEGAALAALGVALAAARGNGAELSRLRTIAPRAAALLVELPPKTIDARLAASLDAEGAVLDGASRDLARARKAVRETRERLVTKLDGILAGLDPHDRPGDASVTVRNGRYVIPVRSTSRARVGGIVHDESATRATVFVEPPEVIELGNELRACETAEQREVLRVLRELTDLVRPHREALAAAWEMSIAFDDLCARARYAVRVNGFAPTVGDGPLAIRDGRHPLLVAGEGLVVGFDLELAPDERTVLVSGPNTGGKTVLIKGVGLLCLLAQSGIVPPLGPQSRLPVFRDVFADIGDRQSIAASLSTFSAHVAVLRDILQRAGAGTLVLLDEIGSGTDPAEGGALASATLTALTRRGAVTLATTHLGALKQLAARTVGIVNASLQFDAETLTPTYRLLKGVPGRSYGLAIARRLGVPADVLEQAERAVPEAERALDALLAAVEARAREQERQGAELAAREAAQREEQGALERRGEAVADRERQLAARERTLEAAGREQARAYLLEARKTVEAALAQARAAVTEATAKQARRMVEEAIEDVGRADRRKGGQQDLKVGDRVRTGQGKVGTVRETRPDGKVLVEVGAIRMLIPSDLLELVAAPPSPSAGPPVSHSAAVTTEVGAISAVSLIGMHLEEAEPLLLRALDAAVQADLPLLRIIHGKGTGALRDLVRRLLRDDPRVAHFDLAPAAQGGSGVTIAELRS